MEVLNYCTVLALLARDRVSRGQEGPWKPRQRAIGPGKASRPFQGRSAFLGPGRRAASVKSGGKCRELLRSLDGAGQRMLRPPPLDTLSHGHVSGQSRTSTSA